MRDPYREPVIIGIGELCEPVPVDLPSCASPLDLMVGATRLACEDTGMASAIIDSIDVVAVVRTFADSTPMYANPFGEVMNYPRAVARRIGANPDRAIYSQAGGNTPQALVNEFCDQIASGNDCLALLVGGEALANSKAALKANLQLDMGDDTEGQVEDRGQGLEIFIEQQQVDNGLVTAPLMYGVLENARRSKYGLSIAAYGDEMGRLFQPFSEIAASHPVSAFPVAFSAEEIATEGPDNPYIASPYTLRTVAKDGVNQSAAVILTSLGRAQELGVPQQRMVFPRSGCSVTERPLIQRPDLAESPAMRLAYQAALHRADVTVADITVMDLYSCFPIAVFEACESLGLDPNGEIPLTVTGGLPFFGGAGNNYSMHSIVNVVARLRQLQSGIGLVGANGGVLSKHSVGLYSAEPADGGWRECDDEALQSQFDGESSIEVDPNPTGAAEIVSYTVAYHRGQPRQAIIIGRTVAGKHFIAHTHRDDVETAQYMHANDPIGETVYVSPAESGTRFSYDGGTPHHNG